VSERNNDDNNMMYTARLQWNVLGGEIDFSQSDFEKTSSQQFNIAVAGASNRTRCTAFETDAVSCRQLAGFDSNPNAGRYRVEQLMAEARYQWAGLSVQSESHWKDITDNEAISNSRTRLWGVYAQTGYFINGMISSVPDDIEVAYRYAIVDPNLDVENDRQTESTLVVNWFEEGHSSKVSLEVAQLRMGLNNRVDNLATQQDDGTRIRAQWDISF
jgi:phosphate-selective porin OprO and OprP